MIDDLLKVADKIIELLKRKEVRRKEVFTSVIKPLFDELLVVHADYLQMFERARLSLEAGKPIKSIVQRLISDRLEKEAERRSIEYRAIAFAHIDSNTDDPVRLFFHDVSYYFRSSHLRATDPKASSLSMKALDLITLNNCKLQEPTDREVDKAIDKYKLTILDLETCIATLRRQWKNVVTSYALVQAQL